MKCETTSLTTRGTPRKVSPAFLRHCIKQMVLTKRSGPHSINGVVLALLLNYCIEHRTPFTLTYQPFPHGGACAFMLVLV